MLWCSIIICTSVVFMHVSVCPRACHHTPWGPSLGSRPSVCTQKISVENFKTLYRQYILPPCLCRCSHVCKSGWLIMRRASCLAPTEVASQWGHYLHTNSLLINPCATYYLWELTLSIFSANSCPFPPPPLMCIMYHIIPRTLVSCHISCITHQALLIIIHDLIPFHSCLTVSVPCFLCSDETPQKKDWRRARKLFKNKPKEVYTCTLTCALIQYV